MTGTSPEGTPEGAQRPDLRWNTPTAHRDTEAQVADVPGHGRYLVKRTVKGARTFVVKLEGKVIAAADSMWDGQQKAARHWQTGEPPAAVAMVPASTSTAHQPEADSGTARKLLLVDAIARWTAFGDMLHATEFERHHAAVMVDTARAMLGNPSA